jgi:flagellar hook-length control protein FliK
MQNFTLPIQVAPTANTPVPGRANVQPNKDTPAFSQTLNREMAQRQAKPAEKTPDTPATPIKAGPGQEPAPAAPATPPAGPVRAAKHIATVDNAVEDTAETAPGVSVTLPIAADPALAAATADVTATAAAATEGAAVAAPVSDMLAMVASYKQLMQGAAAAKPAVAEEATATTKAVKGTSVADDTQTLAALQKALNKSDGADTGKAAMTQAGADDAKPVVSRAAPDLAPTAKSAAPQSDAALSTLRDTAATAVVKDTAPVTGSAFQAQLSSVEMAQTAVTQGSDRIPARLGTTAWDNQVSQKVVWMVGGADQVASLTLNPPDLGPVQVVLNVNNDQATVAFSSATPEVREALENAMPRLREMLGDAGVTLGEASVSANMQDPRQADTSGGNNGQNGNRGNGGNNGNGVRSGETEVPLPRAATRAVRDDGVVDTFA